MRGAASSVGASASVAASPAASLATTAGAAPRERAGGDAMRGSRLGPSFAPDTCEAELAALGAVVHRLDDAPLLDR
ncbi:MAG: hypothetical protein ABIO45_08070, partial [Burkholderiaceae bacterium]